jgi:hypothetical protein
MLIDPRGMGVVEWAHAMALELQPFGLIPALQDPKLWQDWGRAVILNPTISARVPPEPRFFEDWQEWAIRFNQSIYGLSK